MLTAVMENLSQKTTKILSALNDGNLFYLPLHLFLALSMSDTKGYIL